MPRQRMGAVPPALTGREREHAVLGQCLADLLGGEGPPHDVALMGPNGNGKTVLLNWFKGACREAGRIDVARLSPSRTRTGQALVDALSATCRRAPEAAAPDQHASDAVRKEANPGFDADEELRWHYGSIATSDRSERFGVDDRRQQIAGN